MKGCNEEPIVFEKTCPECGRHLVLREGMYGYFIGCSSYPSCRHTEPAPLDELSEEQYEDYKKHPEKYDFKEYHPPSPYCKKCKHTGLIPFKNKEGKVVPNASIFCSCHPVYGDNPEPERYHRVKPSDIDFPVSYSYYRSLCQHHGWEDPGSDFPSDDVDTTNMNNRLNDLEKMITKPGAVPRKYEYQLEQLKAQVLHLQSNVIEYQAEKKVETHKTPTVPPNRIDITDKVYRV